MSGTESIPYTSLPLHKKLKAELQAIADATLICTRIRNWPTIRSSCHFSLTDHQWCNHRRESYPYVARSQDPPGQFARLSLNEESGPAWSFTPQDNGDESSDSQFLSDSGTGNESPSPEIEKKSLANKQPGAKQVRVPLPDIVRINFFDVKDPAAEPRQVPVLSNEIAISTITTADGGIVCKTLLDKVLPVAFQNDSPIKEQGGRIHRESHAGRLHIGKIDAIVDGTVCDVFWDAEARGLESENIVEPVAANAPDPMFPLPADERPKFTGAGTDIPLAIATDRAMHNPTGRLAAPGVREVFLRFLHSVMTQKLDDVPDYGTAWPRAKYAGMLLERILLQEKVLELFTAWSRPTGGYIVPAALHHSQLIDKMATTVRDLILILQIFFPGELSIHKAFYVLSVIISLYPLLRLHLNQRRQPHQPSQTAWTKSIVGILRGAFKLEDNYPPIWASGLDSGDEYSARISDDLAGLLMMLGFNPYNLAEPSPDSLFTAPRIVHWDAVEDIGCRWWSNAVRFATGIQWRSCWHPLVADAE
ncbi:hypothetical protein B0H14DRAFT_3737035 [Mycena olivaceomarginata]|nr:hypothetical protein B0H14DRAFT_3737035 [Mycena olivaceomarginata]